jgi:hypothetical protein
MSDWESAWRNAAELHSRAIERAEKAEARLAEVEQATAGGSLLAENARLRARLAEVEAERDKARKAAGRWRRLVDKIDRAIDEADSGADTE